MPYQLLADAVLALHFGVVVFVVGGLLAVLVGNGFGWRWVNRRGWRLLHLAAVVVVVAQAWLGVLCPLTTLESWLRAQAGETAYSGSFVQHWLQRMLYYEAPLWVFTLVYTAFAALVLWVWWRFPPRRGR
jgi:polyferredoxin